MRSVGSLEGSAAAVFVELTNAEVTRRVLKLQLHGEPASEEPFERIEKEPGAKRPRFFEPFKWLRTRSPGRTVLRSETENFK